MNYPPEEIESIVRETLKTGFLTGIEDVTKKAYLEMDAEHLRTIAETYFTDPRHNIVVNFNLLRNLTFIAANYVELSLHMRTMLMRAAPEILGDIPKNAPSILDLTRIIIEGDKDV